LLSAGVDNLKARVASKKRSIDARIAENVAEDAEDNVFDSAAVHRTMVVYLLVIEGLRRRRDR
jgi:hypothetical protein